MAEECSAHEILQPDILPLPGGNIIVGLAEHPINRILRSEKVKRGGIIWVGYPVDRVSPAFYVPSKVIWRLVLSIPRSE